MIDAGVLELTGAILIQHPDAGVLEFTVARVIQQSDAGVLEQTITGVLELIDAGDLRLSTDWCWITIFMKRHNITIFEIYVFISTSL